jgi:hypothetical protein
MEPQGQDCYIEPHLGILDNSYAASQKANFSLTRDREMINIDMHRLRKSDSVKSNTATTTNYLLRVKNNSTRYKLYKAT